MGTNILNDLDSQLASLNQLKPPGASKGKITSITQLCVNNIQAEQNIVQSLYRALKKAPVTHKLGAIYVVDSVVRRWIEQAKQHNQDLNIEGRGEPGTYSAAVKRITELMPALFDDTFKGIPPEQKEKLEGMIKIWDKGNTFPAKMLADFKVKLSGEQNKATVQTNGAAAREGSAKKMVSEKFSAPVPSRPLYTPIGYPPQHLYDQGLMPHNADHTKQNGVHDRSSQAPQQQQQSVPAQSTQDLTSILASLASLPQPPPQQPHAPAPPQAPQPASTQQPNLSQMPPNLLALLHQNGMPGLPPPPPQLQTPTYQQPAPPQPAQSFQLPPGLSAYPPQPPPSVPQHYAQAPPPPQPVPVQQQADALGPLRGLLPATILADRGLTIKALHLLQDLQKEGVPMDQWTPVLAAFEQQHQPAAQSGYDQYGGGRGRSRSPERGGRRRASPVYGNYEDLTRKQGNDDRGRAGRNRYRERTPMRDSPGASGVAMNGMPMQPKFVGHDPNLPAGCIKVLSRTLFVGGATGSQQEIETLFSRFGRVQTIIANRDKRHAFVKMSTRSEALTAKKQLELAQNANDKEVVNVARQTKWGVGFGPRECCDYTTGESTIPIHKLTDADMKWMLTAEYGGTGGQKVEPGMVVEEPDIEIGAGVSSKAMSKRVLPDTGAPPNKRQHREEGGQRNGGGRDRDRDRGKRQTVEPQQYGYGAGVAAQQQQQQPPPPMQYGHMNLTPVQVATPPAVPGFSFTLPGPQGGYR